MSTQYPELFARLAAPFDGKEVKTRQQAGRSLSYITARTAMNRLDMVLGGENWWDDYIPQENSVLCRLTIRFPDGSTVTKADAGGYAGMADSGDDDKSGYSDAFKRAAVKFGVGRYLYRDGVPQYDADGNTPAPAVQEEPQRAQQRPQQAAGAARERQAEQRPPDRQQPQGGHDGPPRTGKALFAWACNIGKQSDIDVVKELNDWGKRNSMPRRMIDWADRDVTSAFEFAQREILQPAHAGREPGDD